MSGTLRLLGALCVELDMEAAWSFAAAMLNNVPPNRPSASALLAFLQTAGNALCGHYDRQVCEIQLIILGYAMSSGKNSLFVPINIHRCPLQYGRMFKRRTQIVCSM